MWVYLSNDLRSLLVNIRQAKIPRCQQNSDGIKINESCNFSFWRWGLRNQKGGFPGWWELRRQQPSGYKQRLPRHHTASWVAETTPPGCLNLPPWHKGRIFFWTIFRSTMKHTSLLWSLQSQADHRFQEISLCCWTVSLLRANYSYKDPPKKVAKLVCWLFGRDF